MILVYKGTCALVTSPFKGHRGQWPRNVPSFRRPWVLVYRKKFLVLCL